MSRASTPDLPEEILKAAWRVDKAWQRCEGMDSMFWRIKTLAWICQEHGLPGVADWLLSIVEKEGVPLV